MDNINEEKISEDITEKSDEIESEFFDEELEFTSSFDDDSVDDELASLDNESENASENLFDDEDIFSDDDDVNEEVSFDESELDEQIDNLEDDELKNVDDDLTHNGTEEGEVDLFNDIEFDSDMFKEEVDEDESMFSEQQEGETHKTGEYERDEGESPITSFEDDSGFDNVEKSTDIGEPINVLSSNVRENEYPDLDEISLSSDLATAATMVTKNKEKEPTTKTIVANKEKQVSKKVSIGVPLVVSLLSVVISISFTLGWDKYKTKENYITDHELKSVINKLNLDKLNSEKRSLDILDAKYITSNKYMEKVIELEKGINTNSNELSKYRLDSINTLTGIKKSIDNLRSEIEVQLSEQGGNIKNLDLQMTKIKGNAVKDNAARAGLMMTMKKLESIEKTLELEAEAIKQQQSIVEKKLSLRINELDSKLLTNVEEFMKENERASRVQKNLENKVNELNMAIDSNKNVKQQNRTVSNALGIDIVKGNPKPIYTLSGIVNGRVFIDMDSAPNKQKIRYYNVGDYIEGYGKILSVNSITKEVITENGVVMFN